MAWVAEENFDSYSNGNLVGNNGGSGWSGAWTGSTVTQVEGTTVFQGTKAVSATNGNANTPARALTTAVSSGVMYIAFRRDVTTGDSGWRVLTGSSVWMSCFMESSNIEINHSLGTLNLVTGYSTGVWYVFELTILTNATFSVRVNAGGAGWQASSGVLIPQNIGDVGSVALTCGGGAGSNGFWDYISATNPYPETAIKTIDGLAKASVKTVDGLAIASVKTFNGLA